MLCVHATRQPAPAGSPDGGHRDCLSTVDAVWLEESSDRRPGDQPHFPEILQVVIQAVVQPNQRWSGASALAADCGGRFEYVFLEVVTHQCIVEEQLVRLNVYLQLPRIDFDWGNSKAVHIVAPVPGPAGLPRLRADPAVEKPMLPIRRLREHLQPLQQRPGFANAATDCLPLEWQGFIAAAITRAGGCGGRPTLAPAR